MKPEPPPQPRHLADPDARKGALEGDRPTDRQHSNPHGKGINEEGLPSDEKATAEDVIGAQEDKTQG